MQSAPLQPIKDAREERVRNRLPAAGPAGASHKWLLTLISRTLIRDLDATCVRLAFEPRMTSPDSGLAQVGPRHTLDLQDNRT